MANTSEFQTAERLSRQRARMLTALAIIYVTQMATLFGPGGPADLRSVDYVKIGAWLVLSVVILLALVTGGYWFHSPRVREILNDEHSRANRREGMRAGFIAAMIGTMVVVVVSLFRPVDGGQAARVLMTIGLGAALLRFGTLERRGHGDGC